MRGQLLLKAPLGEEPRRCEALDVQRADRDDCDSSPRGEGRVAESTTMIRGFVHPIILMGVDAACENIGNSDRDARPERVGRDVEDARFLGAGQKRSQRESNARRTGSATRQRPLDLPLEDDFPGENCMRFAVIRRRRRFLLTATVQQTIRSAKTLLQGHGVFYEAGRSH